MLRVSRKQIAVAFCFAVMFWCFIYLLVFVVLVASRWQAQQSYLEKAANAQTQSLAADDENIVLVPEQKVVPKVNPLEKYQHTAQSLIEELTAAQIEIHANVNVMLGHLETLREAENSPIWNFLESINPKVDEDTGDTVSLEHWERLLTTPSLEEISSDEELEWLFQTAMQEIKVALTDFNNDNNVRRIHQFLTDDYVQTLKRHDRTFECPSPTLQVESRGGSAMVPPNAVYERDLYDRLEAYDKIFTKRTNGHGINVLLTETRTELEDLIVQEATALSNDFVATINESEKQIQQLLDDVLAAQTASEACRVDTDLVTALVDSGLKAMAANADVREALRTTALSKDSSLTETDLILDADLPTIHDSTQVGSTVVNLRSVIDSPLLIQTVDWIDILVDLVGGYNDRLDQYLDSLTKSGSGSVGEVVVEKCLTSAGLIEVDVKKVLDKLRIPTSLRDKIVRKLLS